MIVYYVKADHEKRRPVGTIMKCTDKRYKELKVKGLVEIYTGQFPPRKKIKFNLKDLK